MKKKIICINCGKTFTVSRKSRFDVAKFCSRKCKHQYSYVTLKCEYCGKTFQRARGIFRTRKAVHVFCSFGCRFNYNKINGSWNKGMNIDEVACDWCGKKIIKPHSILKQYVNHFCSKDCYNRWMSKNKVGQNNNSWKSKEVICDQCHKSFLLPPSKINRYPHLFCSNKCKYQWMSDNLSGENNHNWSGGHDWYRGEDWVEQRKKAKQRDEYTCQKCGITNVALVVHHIIPFRWFGNDRYKEANQLENLLTCCKSCHGKAEFESRKMIEEMIICPSARYVKALLA